MVGRTLDFDFPPSQDVARLDYTFTFNSDDTKVTGTIMLTTFPLQGDPLDGGGTVEGQFTYNREPLAGCRQKSITILPLVSQGENLSLSLTEIGPVVMKRASKRDSRQLPLFLRPTPPPFSLVKFACAPAAASRSSPGGTPLTARSSANMATRRAAVLGAPSETVRQPRRKCYFPVFCSLPCHRKEIRLPMFRRYDWQV